jgi:hypothetical protein
MNDGIGTAEHGPARIQVSDVAPIDRLAWLDELGARPGSDR